MPTTHPPAMLRKSLRRFEMEKGLCAGNLYDAENFHLDNYQADAVITKEAVDLCDTPCPVREDCLAYAMINKFSGVWGGKTSRQRANMLREDEWQQWLKERFNLTDEQWKQWQEGRLVIS